MLVFSTKQIDPQHSRQYLSYLIQLCSESQSCQPLYLMKTFLKLFGHRISNMQSQYMMELNKSIVGSFGVSFNNLFIVHFYSSNEQFIFLYCVLVCLWCNMIRQKSRQLPFINLVTHIQLCFNGLLFIQFNNINMRRVNDKYAYISHPDNLPLQIDGRAKQRVKKLKKEQFNGDKPSINHESRSLLLKKIANNTHNLDHLKSVLPTDDVRKKSRTNSIKTFNENKENISSGIDYLMQKTQGLKAAHKEKAHISQFCPPSTKRPQKKHFTSLTIQEAEAECSKTKKTHKQTMEIKLTNDLYSNVYREEKEKHQCKKMEGANLFKSGQDLGFEKKKEKVMTDQKLMEMFGSQCMRAPKAPLRERRQDWRNSNINFF